MLEKKGQTFYWLAKESGITHSTVSKLRHGTIRELGVDMLDKLCVALECQPGDFIVHVPEKKARAK